MNRVLLRIWPQRIAGQITILVAASALMFHLCLGAAFFLAPVGREGSPRAQVTRLAFAVNLIGAARADARPALLTSIMTLDPDLRLETDPDPEPTVARPPPDLPADMADLMAPGIAVNWADHGRDRASLVFRLRDGAGLRAATPGYALLDGHYQIRFMATLFFMALTTTLFVLWAVRSVTRPMQALAEASDVFALQEQPQLLIESGPTEVLSVSRAFNRMQSRIIGMVADRTRMLAAVSHDLRTPITRMRLRTEFIEDDGLRATMERDLGHMESLVNGALSFIRNRAVAKKPERLDVAVLLRTVCDEFGDLGQSVEYRGPDHLIVTGHSDELQRAVTNLVDNASHYGDRTTVSLDGPDQGSVDVRVCDNGPGIPDEYIPHVMQPFRRGPAASLGDTGGFGLGLPIVSAIVAAHGGELTLTNLQPHGLSCRIRLPHAG